MPFKVTAFIAVYNEADILAWTLRHLERQGIGAYIIDNWSTDCSVEIAKRFSLVGFEHFPAAGPVRWQQWREILRRKALLASQSDADWCMHYDADELRYSPVPGETLLEAFQRVDELGYKAVNFKVIDFRPVDDNWNTGLDPEQYFRYYKAASTDSNLPQIKAWKNTGKLIDMLRDGGHTIDGISKDSIYPERFLLKHYPLRTAKQAERKVLLERIPRYHPCENVKGWHIQYNDLLKTRKWISDPVELALYDDAAVTV